MAAVEKQAAKNKPKGGKPERPGEGVAVGRHKFSSAVLMLFLTAVLMPLLFPPFYWWFLAQFALVPFTICVIRRRLNWGWVLMYYLLGVAFFVPSLFWLGPVTVGGYIAVALYMALYFPVYAIGVHRLVVQLRMPALVAVPLVWTAVEYVRSSFVLGGFPWFNLGNCLAPVPVFIQIADIFGVWGVTFFIGVINGCYVDMLRLPLMRVEGGRSRFNPQLKRVVGTAATCLVFVLGYGIFRLAQHTTTPGPVLAVIQDNIPQSNKEDAGNREEIFVRHYELSRAAIASDPKPSMVIWPETMVPLFCNEEYLNAPEGAFKGFADPDFWIWAQERGKEYVRALQVQADRGDVHLLVGIGALVPRGDYGSSIRQNRSVLISPGRGAVDWYAKVHRVPFGEFIPLSEVGWAKAIMHQFSPNIEDYAIAAGDRWTRFVIEDPPGVGGANGAGTSAATAVSAVKGSGEVKRYGFGTPICFEDTMPYPSQRMTKANGGKKADFLVNISNEGWFQWVELDQHLQASCLRAVENRVPMARSVNTGNSGFIDANGRVVKLVVDKAGRSIGARGFAVHRVEVDSRETIYTQVGDIFPMLCGMACVLTVGWTLVRPRKGVAQEASNLKVGNA